MLRLLFTAAQYLENELDEYKLFCSNLKRAGIIKKSIRPESRCRIDAIAVIGNAIANRFKNTGLSRTTHP